MHRKDDEPGSSHGKGCLYKATSNIDGGMRNVFFKVGYVVSGRPFLVISVSLLLTLLALIGMIRFESESRTQNLWVAPDAVSRRNFDFVRERYGNDVRFSNIIFANKDGSGSIASRSKLLNCLKIAEIGFNTVAQVKNGSMTQNITFEDNCVKTKDAAGNNACLTESAFDLFYDSSKVVYADEGELKIDFFASVRKALDSMTDEEIREKFEKGPFISVSGVEMNPTNIISSSGKGSNFNVDALFYTRYSIGTTEVVGGYEVDSSNDALEEAWMDRLVGDENLIDESSVVWKVRTTFGELEALDLALSGDLPKLSVGFVLLLAYVCAFLGDCHAVRSRIFLGFFGLINAGLALAVTFGLGSAFGMFFGPVHQILPLLVIGIGVDDVFVITRAVDDVNRHPSFGQEELRLRVALACSNAGSAITVSSATNMTVFFLAAISKLPALRYFSIWAGIGVAIDWAFTLTFYTALLTLDMRRQANNRRDCCPCFKVSGDVDREPNCIQLKPGAFSRFFENYFGPFVMKKYIRIFLITIFTALFAVCIWGCSNLYMKFQPSFLYPTGSDLREFQDLFVQFFDINIPSPIYLSETDISTKENQLRYIELCHSSIGVIARNEYIEDGSVDCWYEKFRSFKNVANGQVISPATFYSELESFLNSPRGFKYKNDIVLRNGSFESARFNALRIPTETNAKEIEALLGVREAADSVGFGKDNAGNPRAFPYYFSDLITEQYKVLPREIFTSLALACTAVALVCLSLIGHPLVALNCFIVIIMIVVDVLGFTYFSGINLNSISMITIVITTGIAVDYVLHISRSFLEQVGTKETRAVKSLSVLGPPVFYSGFSTLSAIIGLAFASSYIFKVIFFGFFSLVIIGLSHGLIFSPLLLSLVGPPGFFSTEEEKEESERDLIRNYEHMVNSGASS